MHSKAVALLETLFPQECPLLTHISQTYEKRFVTELHEIPEASESVHHIRKPSSRARTSRIRKSTKSSDFSELQHSVEQGGKKVGSPGKQIASARGYTRSQTSLKTRGEERPRSSVKKARTKSEAFVGEQFYKKKSTSRSKLKEVKQTCRTRERRNKSAELIRRGDPEPSFLSFDQGDNIPPSQFFIS